MNTGNSWPIHQLLWSLKWSLPSLSWSSSDVWKGVAQLGLILMRSSMRPALVSSSSHLHFHLLFQSLLCSPPFSPSLEPHSFDLPSPHSFPLELPLSSSLPSTYIITWLSGSQFPLLYSVSFCSLWIRILLVVWSCNRSMQQLFEGDGAVWARVLCLPQGHCGWKCHRAGPWAADGVEYPAHQSDRAWVFLGL